VAHDIGQRFLCYSEACRFDFAGETFILIGHVDNQLYMQTGAFCITIYIPVQSRNEAEIVKDGRAQFNREIAN
jgi:hypothetical protein